MQLVRASYVTPHTYIHTTHTAAKSLTLQSFFLGTFFKKGKKNMDMFTVARFVFSFLFFIVTANTKCAPEAYVCEQCCCYTKPLDAVYCMGNHVGKIPRYNKLALSSTHIFIEDTGIYSLKNLDKYYNLLLVSVKNNLIACPSVRIYAEKNKQVTIETDCPKILTTPQNIITTTTTILTSNQNTRITTKPMTSSFFSESQTKLSTSQKSSTYEVETVSVEPPLSTLLIPLDRSTSSKESDSTLSGFTDGHSDPPSTENINSTTNAYKNEPKLNKTNEIILLCMVLFIISIAATFMIIYSIIKCRRRHSYNINRTHNRPPSANAVYNPHILRYENLHFPSCTQINRIQPENIDQLYEDIELQTIEVNKLLFSLIDYTCLSNSTI